MDILKWITILCFFISLEGSTNVYVSEGSIGSLTCQITAIATSLQWSGPNNTLTIGNNVNPNIPQKDRISVVITDEEYQLNISNVQPIDFGAYTCVFTVHNVTKQRNFVLRLRVQLTSVDFHPSGPVEIQNTFQKQFTCSTRSLPSAVITWYFNFIETIVPPSTPDVAKVTSVYNYTGDKNDTGKMIHCSATSDGTTVVSVDAVLNITFGPGNAIFLDPPTTPIEKTVGELLEPVKCFADCNPSCQYRWTKDGQLVVQNDTLSMQSSLVKTDHGMYECKAWNSIGETKISLQIIVNYGPANTSLSPNKTTYTVEELTPLPAIKCSADCRPTCTKYWIKPNGQVIQLDTLNIGSINRTEAGTYRCYVNNTVSSSMSYDVKMVVRYGPGNSQNLDPPATSNEKIKGEQLDSIRCTADCSPPCKFQWIRDNKIIAGNTLFIPSLDKTDHGTYICRAWNTLNESTIDFMLVVNYGPEHTILSPNKTVYTVQELSALPAITCKTDCRPICTTFWIRPNSQYIQFDTLNLGRINRTEAGTYRCYVNNTVSSLKSYDVEIVVTYGPGTSQSLDPPATSNEMIKGEQLNSISCKADCYPSCQFQWIKNNKIIAENDILFIPSLNINDHGTYSCRAWNDVNESTIEFFLIVNYGPEYINLTPDNTTFTVEELTKLPVITCNTDCRPNCTKYWIAPNNQVSQSDTLDIARIQRTQAGTYLCYVNNTVNSSQSRDISIIVSYGAIVSSLETHDGNFTVNENQEVNMTCHVDGVPIPKIEWTRDGNKINNLENKTNHIFTAACDNTANYTCAASNNLARQNLTKEVFVLCYPRVSMDISTDKLIGLKDGEGLNITVTLLAYPPPKIDWYFKNMSVVANNSFGVYQHISNLYKPMMAMDDFGFYHMFTSNSLGNANYDISVEAERSPDPPVIVSARCAHHTLKVVWNSSFNGGVKQTFIVEATNVVTKENTRTGNYKDSGVNPFNATVKNLHPGTLYEVVIIAENYHGHAISEGTANCTTNSFASESSNTIAVAAGAGTGSALIILSVVIILVWIQRRRAVSRSKRNDKEPIQRHLEDADENDGLKDNPMYVSSGSEFLTTDTDKMDSSEGFGQVLKQGQKEKQNKDDTSRANQRQKIKKGKENKAIELGCVYENADDFVKQGEQIYANGNEGKGITSIYSPQKNKDGLIYADLDLAPLSAERQFVIRGLENKSNYAMIDLSKKAEPLSLDEEED